MRKKRLRFFNIWSEHLLRKWNQLEKDVQRIFLFSIRKNYVSFRASLLQVVYFHFDIFWELQTFSPSIDLFRCWCWRKVLPSNLWQKTLKLIVTLEKGKSTKLEEKSWIKNCAQNEKSIFLQARLSKCQPRLQVFNLEPKSRKLQEKSFELHIAP